MAIDLWVNTRLFQLQKYRDGNSEQGSARCFLGYIPLFLKEKCTAGKGLPESCQLTGKNRHSIRYDTNWNGNESTLPSHISLILRRRYPKCLFEVFCEIFRSIETNHISHFTYLVSLTQ